jgi:diguanylate cyclase (GGDEF)-like protein
MTPLLLLLAFLAAAGVFALGHAWGVRRAASSQVQVRDAWLRVSPDALLLLDDHDRLLDANDAAHRLLDEAGLRQGAALAALDPKWLRLSRWDAAAEGTLRVDGRSFEVGGGELHDGRGRRAGRWLRLHDVTEVVEADALVRTMAATDELTGVANRRHFLQRAERELDRAYRYGRPLSLVTLELEGLAEVNASFGYAAGDALLRAVAATVVADVRSCDVVGRIEGDRFGLLLPEADRARAEIAAARLRAQVAELEVPSAGEVVRARPRVGVAGIGVDEVDVEVPHDLGWLMEAARADESRVGSPRPSETRADEARSPDAATLADVTEAA